jgi:hypothetical protein
MYGLVNKAIEDLISREHGTDTWERVMQRAGVDDAGFVSMDSYPDELTYGLVGAASNELGVPVDDLLEAFGRYWILYTGREGYGELLDLSGATFGEFLENLDNLHTRVGLSFPDLRPPSFSCVTVGDGRYELRYRSGRDGLAPMVVGLVKGLADKFGLDVTMRHEVRRGRDGDHDMFVIEAKPD